jgi:hypothetical protein
MNPVVFFDKKQSKTVSIFIRKYFLAGMKRIAPQCSGHDGIVSIGH